MSEVVLLAADLSGAVKEYRIITDGESEISLRFASSVLHHFRTPYSRHFFETGNSLTPLFSAFIRQSLASLATLHHTQCMTCLLWSLIKSLQLFTCNHSW